jgi:hypothetical protein
VQSSDESEVSIGVDEDLHVEELPQRRYRKYQNALENNDWLWFDPFGFRKTHMVAEIVDRERRRLTSLEKAKVLHEQLFFDRIRMVEVVLWAPVIFKMGKIVVIPVLVHGDDALGTDSTNDLIGNRGFARAAAACHSDTKSLHQSTRARERLRGT